ncbi:MAG: SpoIIE family protein phosphatase [Bryobacteraceae bacterium]|nr:SpoIIE family protein phosphatase [Bryobacteraceae bacterium]
MVTAADILNARILVVDDNPANVALMEGMLRVAGYTSVDSTTDPNRVCELYRQTRYGLILLDLQMPGINGFEVMEGLRQIEQNGYLPVLVITAQPDHKLRALAAGAKDFVSKPFEMAELRARVRNILEVRLLHLESKRHGEVLEQTVRELEAAREGLRLKALQEQKAMEKEMALAQETQESLLPRSMPTFENFHVYAFSNPTRYVGGDFYDFLQTGSGEWMGVLADVSGKGIPAALLSSMTLGALSMALRSGAEPHDAVSLVNLLLCEKSPEAQFVTLFLFVLSPGGSGRFVSAGHTATFLFRASTGRVERLVTNSFFLGMFEEATYETVAFHMDKGDLLVVYSDGVTDARNQQDEMFGEVRLINMIKRVGPSGSHTLKQTILWTIEEFTENVLQTDDITLIVVEKRE